jgi:hypothetical protein
MMDLPPPVRIQKLLMWIQNNSRGSKHCRVIKKIMLILRIYQVL